MEDFLEGEEGGPARRALLLADLWDADRLRRAAVLRAPAASKGSAA